jgi:hypothetical protein
MAWCSDDIALDRFAAPEDFSLGWLDQRANHLQRGGFAGPVWTEIPRDFARGSREAYIVHGGNARIHLRDAAYFEHTKE